MSVLFWLGPRPADLHAARRGLRRSASGPAPPSSRAAAHADARLASRRGGGEIEASPYTSPAMRFLSRFVDSNDRELRRIQPIVDEVNALEEEIEALTDDEIRARFAEIRDEIREVAEPDEPSDDELHHPDLERRRDLTKARRKKENERIQAALDDVAGEVFAMGREAMKRTLGMRHYDVQMMGGVVLHQGKIAEMKTGEGKTFIPTFAAVLNSLTRPRRPRRHRQRLPGPARPAVDGPRLPLPRRQRRDDHPRRVVRLRAGLPDHRRAADQPPAGHPQGGLRRRHHLRHEQRVRLRLPPRQHGRRTSTSGCSASAASRSSTRSTTS